MTMRYYYTAFALFAAAMITLLSLQRCENQKLKDQITSMEMAAQRFEIEALEAQRSIEREWQEKANAAASSAAQELADVEANYENSIQSLYELLADRSADRPADSLQSDSTDSSPAALPAATDPATGDAGRAACQCRCADSDSFRRLLERQMTIARDCDINDAYLHRWIDFYQSLR